MASVHSFPAHGWIGILLIAAGWPLAWIRPEGMQALWENSFLLLWSGYNLVVDSLNLMRTGTSLLTRNRYAYLGMFLLSIPGWWLFELLNLFLQNWHYLHNRHIGGVEYALRASLHFSVVIPAVLSTAELWASTGILSGWSHRRGFVFTKRGLLLMTLTGTVMLIFVIALPRYFYPLTWGCLYLVFDSINRMLGAPSLLRHLENGNWRPALALPLGALSCGFFWEMWNFHSLPKWFYTIPFVDFLHIFEMPAPGYLGYLPFGLEIYALYMLLIELTGLKKTRLYGGGDYVRL